MSRQFTNDLNLPLEELIQHFLEFLLRFLITGHVHNQIYKGPVQYDVIKVFFSVFSQLCFLSYLFLMNFYNFLGILIIIISHDVDFKVAPTTHAHIETKFKMWLDEIDENMIN